MRRRLGSGGFVGEFAGDQAGATVERKIEEAPLDEDNNAALELDDVDEVNEEPDEPGNEAGDVDPENVGDCGSPADDGHIAFVEILEGRKSAAGEASFDKFGGVFSALDGDLGNAWEWFPFRVEGSGQIAEDENFGMVGDSEIRIDHEAADAIGLGIEALGNFVGEGGGGNAAGPENGARW